MDRKRFVTMLGGLAAVALLAGAAIATKANPPPPDLAHAHRGPPPGPGLMVPGMLPPGALPHLAKELGLSADQQAEIRGVLEQAKPGFEQLHLQMRTNFELLARTRPDDPSYQTVVSNVSQSASELAAQLVLQGSRVRSQVFAVLNADQKQKLTELESRPHGWHGKGGRDPGDHGPDQGPDHGAGGGDGGSED